MSEMWYNMSLAAQNSNGVLGLVQTVNNNFFLNFFGTAILITLSIILVRNFVDYTDNIRQSVLYTLFIVAILSILFKLLYLVPDAVVYIFWAGFAVYFGYYILTNG